MTIKPDGGRGGDGDGGGGGDNQSPTAITLSAASVEEQAPGKTVIGNLAAEDPDEGDTHTFEIADDPDNLFAIEGDELRVAEGATLNFEAKAEHILTVRAIDAASEAVEEEFAIEVLDLREVVNTTDSGAGSLRQTIADAAPGETILFETGVAGRISVLSPLLLTKAVTIRGPTVGEISLDGRDNNRVIEVAVGAQVALENLRIFGGADISGAGINNEGVLVIERSILEDNHGSGSGRGGAIANLGTLTVRDTLFRNNTAFNGGAVAAQGDGTTIERCTFDSNSTSGNSGGAIAYGPLKVINSTFSGNTASSETQNRVGGAIALFGGTNEIAFSTFGGNSADGSGAGIYVGSGAVLTVRGSLLSENSAPAGPDLDAQGSVSGQDNVLSDGSDSGLTDGQDNNLVGVTVTLSQLADNGGPTPTLLPTNAPPSINRIPVESCTDLNGDPLSADQRGLDRPQSDVCDTGAVETN